MNTHTDTTNLLHHLILFMEELHLDVSTNWQRLGEFEKHVLVLTPRVSGVRRVNLHFQLVHHKLGICKKNVDVGTGRRGAGARLWDLWGKKRQKNKTRRRRRRRGRRRRRVSDKRSQSREQDRITSVITWVWQTGTAHHHQSPTNWVSAKHYTKIKRQRQRKSTRSNTKRDPEPERQDPILIDSHVLVLDQRNTSHTADFFNLPSSC